MDYEKTGKTISYLRRIKGYTQKDLAKQLDISDKAVSKWERGLGIPDVSLLAKLSIILDTDIESLLEGNVSHYKQRWAGILIIDEPINDAVFAGTLINRKPIVHYLISYYMLIGIRDILIISSKESKNFIDSEIGNGQDFGISIHTINNDVSTEYINIFKNFVGDRHLTLICGYEFIYGLDLTKMMQRAMSKKNTASLLVFPYCISKQSKHVVYDINRKILKLEDDEKVDSIDEHYRLPILFCSNKALWCIENTSSTMDELIQNLIDKGVLYAEFVGRGMVVVEIKDFSHVKMVTEFVRMMNKTHGEEIASLKEVADRRGLI